VGVGVLYLVEVLVLVAVTLPILNVFEKLKPGMETKRKLLTVSGHLPTFPLQCLATISLLARIHITPPLTTLILTSSMSMTCITPLGDVTLHVGDVVAVPGPLPDHKLQKKKTKALSKLLLPMRITSSMMIWNIDASTVFA
jgi:hypothetical protein